ncbi:hypothetical protein D6D03_10196 [Aureobasidium pullulans]|nr:hypothetical protein D6D03_10196 [Aureobasidium pullulans]
MEASTTQQSKRHSFTNNLITISLQLLLWSSLFPLSIQISFFALSEVDSSLFLTNIICIAAAGTSLLVILVHSLIVRLQGSVFSRWAKTAATVFKVIILFVSCTAVLLWITTVGLGIIFTLARQPTCRPASSGTHEMWRKGRVCVLQRIALVVSMLAFIVSFVLCFTYNVSYDPFTAGLFGSKKTSVCLSPSDLQRTPQMVKKHSTLSFKCRSALLSPIAASSPLRISSPLRMAMNAGDEKPNGLGISSSRPSIEKSPLLSKSPSHSSSHSVSSSGTMQSLHKASTAYVPSVHTYLPSRVPTAYVPSPHGTHLYSPKHLPKTISASAPAIATQSASLGDAYPPKQSFDLPPIQTTSLYSSRRVSSTFLTPTSHMGPPAPMNFSSPRRGVPETMPVSPPVHMPLTRPTNLYSMRRAPTPYTPAIQGNGPAPRRFPVVLTPPSQSNRLPSALLAPPPSIRQLNSARRGVSYASNTSSIYSRHVGDDK